MHLQQEGCREQGGLPKLTHSLNTEPASDNRTVPLGHLHQPPCSRHSLSFTQSFLRQRSWKAPILGPYPAPLHSQNALAPLAPHCLLLNRAIIRTLPIGSCNVAVFSGGKSVKAWDREGETRYFRTECLQRGPTTGCSKEGSKTILQPKLN